MDSLQFQKAEYAGGKPKCAACQTPIEREYFQYGGQLVCSSCAERIRTGHQRPPNSDVVRGLIFGAGAAVACSAAYAAITMAIKSEWAIIAIAVGFVVGKAIRKGSNGLGGRRLQLIAVGLTYLAITFSYVPLMLQQAEQVQVSAAAIVYLAGIALFLPFLSLSEGISGILGLLIIGFGLLQAWRLTARDPRELTGPHPVEGAAHVD